MNWETFKSFLTTKGKTGADLLYVKASTAYHILLRQDEFTFGTFLKISSPASLDQVDFEENFKSDATERLPDAE